MVSSTPTTSPKAARTAVFTARDTTWPWIAAAACPAIAVVAAVTAGVGAPWRPLIALWFLLVGPGASTVPLLGLGEKRVELALVVPLSLALLTLTSASLFYARLWTPHRELALLVTVCALGLGLQAVVARGGTERAA